MELSDYLEQKRGRAAELARFLKVRPVNVSRWAGRQKPVPPRFGGRIELWSNLSVRRWDLRPADWHEHWPDLVGTEGAPPVRELEEVGHAA